MDGEPSEPQSWSRAVQSDSEAEQWGTSMLESWGWASLLGEISNRTGYLDCRHCWRPVKSLTLGMLDPRCSLRMIEVKKSNGEKEKRVGVL